MNFLKIEKGGFFGILVPGFFLLLNLLYAFSSFPLFKEFNLVNSENNLSIELGLIYFLFSVILGVVLRIVSYRFIELFGSNKFPYFKYYFEENNILQRPIEFQKFYEKYTKTQFPSFKGNWYEKISSLDKNTGRIWINYFKVSIYLKNPELKSEILYLEGISRLSVGMIYALIISLFAIVINVFYTLLFSSTKNLFEIILILIYILLLLIIWKRIAWIRGKEVTTVLDAFSLL